MKREVQLQLLHKIRERQHSSCEREAAAPALVREKAKMRSYFYWGYEETLLFSCWQTHGPVSFALSTVVLFSLCLLSAWLKLRCHEVEERRGIAHTSAALGSRGCCSCSPNPGSSSARRMQQHMQQTVACGAQPVCVCDAAGGEASRHLPDVLTCTTEARRSVAAEAFSLDREATSATDTASGVVCAAAGSLHTAARCHGSSTSSSSSATSSSGSSSRVFAPAEDPGDSGGEPPDAEEGRRASNIAEGAARPEDKQRRSGGAGNDEQKLIPLQRQLYQSGVEKPGCLLQHHPLHQRQEQLLRRTEIILSIETWLLTFFAAAIDWALMLVCMTFNAGLFLVIIGGIATGRALTSASLASSLTHWSWLQQQEQHG